MIVPVRMDRWYLVDMETRTATVEKVRRNGAINTKYQAKVTSPNVLAAVLRRAEAQTKKAEAIWANR